MPGRIERLVHRFRPEVARRLPLPDFLGIGAQKSGTTWLGENLSRHPQVFLPQRKAAHYFDHYWNRPLREYTCRFEPAQGRVKGEITAAYGILPPARIRYVRRVMPRVRLLLLLRNPVDRAWSHAVMDLAARQGRSLDQVGADEAIEFFESEPAVRRGDYNAILDAWLRVFPREQLYVGFLDWIRDRPRELLTDVFRHIGVSTDVDWSEFPLGRVIVPGVAPDRTGHIVEHREAAGGGAEPAGHPCPEPLRRWLEQRYAKDIDALARRLGGPAETWRIP